MRQYKGWPVYDTVAAVAETFPKARYYYENQVGLFAFYSKGLFRWFGFNVVAGGYIQTGSTANKGRGVTKKEWRERVPK